MTVPRILETLDSAAIAKELGALVVKLNGPRYWVLDALGSKGKPIEPVLHEFNGLLMRRIAVLELGSNPVQVPYTLRKVDRPVAMYFDADSAVYELIDPHGLSYVMQAYRTESMPHSTRSLWLTSATALRFLMDGGFERVFSKKT